jgi:nucleoid-associated protein YgaU
MGLEKAIIKNTQTGEDIKVQYNPEEYSLDLGNTFAEIGIPGLQASPIQYVRGNLRTLKMELFFDTYEAKRDVRTETRKITSLLYQDQATQAPPILEFIWGGPIFRCVLESVGQTFTLFAPTGEPVRAKLSVSFKEFEPVDIEIQRGFFVGPPTVRNVVEGETLSQLSGELLGDPGDWRDIAELNNIDDPFNLPVGMALAIPTGGTPGQGRS